MRFVRPLLSIAVVIVVALLPVFTHFGPSADTGQGVAQAESIGASAGRAPAVLQATPTPTPTATPTGNGNGNGNCNGNDNNGNDNNGNGNGNDNNGNGNGNCNGNGNDNNGNDNNGNDNNGNGNDNNGNGNDNGGNDNGGNGNGNGNFSFTSPSGPQATPTPFSTTSSQCFDPQQSGSLAINLSGGTATLTVPSGAGFAQATMLRLEQADLSSSPQTPGTRVDSFLFNVRSYQGCNGPEAALPSPVNLGISFNTAVDKSKVHIAVYQNSQWVDVTVVPDPNPSTYYVSATIRSTGLYTVYTTS